MTREKCLPKGERDENSNSDEAHISTYSVTDSVRNDITDRTNGTPEDVPLTPLVRGTRFVRRTVWTDLFFLLLLVLLLLSLHTTRVNARDVLLCWRARGFIVIIRLSQWRVI